MSKTTTAKVAITVPMAVLKRVDSLVKRRVFPNRSSVKIGQIRSLSIERLGGRIGRASSEELTEIVDDLNEIIGG